MRDRIKTRQKILNSLGQLIAENGFGTIGVNAVARAAGVDKVLIYRYFGGLPELLEAYGRESEFWPSLNELCEGSPAFEDLAPAERAKRVLRRFGEALARRPITLEILRWELFERNELTEALAKVREEVAVDLIRRIDAPEQLDVAALATILSTAQIYMVLRSRTVDTFNGIRLDSPAGQARLSATIDRLVDLAIASVTDNPSAGR